MSRTAITGRVAERFVAYRVAYRKVPPPDERFKGGVQAWKDPSRQFPNNAKRLLAEMSRLRPTKAAKRLLEEIRSDRFAERYTALGVWDVVMSSDISPYVWEFAKLKPEVAASAYMLAYKIDIRSVRPRGPVAGRFVTEYFNGRATGKLSGDFDPPEALWVED